MNKDEFEEIIIRSRILDEIALRHRIAKQLDYIEALNWEESQRPMMESIVYLAKQIVTGQFENWALRKMVFNDYVEEILKDLD